MEKPNAIVNQIDMCSETPPVLPPKQGSHETSRRSPLSATESPGLSPPPPSPSPLRYDRNLELSGFGSSVDAQTQQPSLTDPGHQWLPEIIQGKSKHDLAEILSSPSLLSALTHAPQTIHPSLEASHRSLISALKENIELATHLTDLEAKLVQQREATQAQLIATNVLDRQWRQKQSEMDQAMAPFSPASLYQRLGQGVQEQEGVCHALEESFLEGEGDGAPATEREALDWARRYREAKKLYYLRQERKERWDEGRVGGWR